MMLVTIVNNKVILVGNGDDHFNYWHDESVKERIRKERVIEIDQCTVNSAM